MTAEEILNKCTGLTINDEDAYIIHTKTENVLKAMREFAEKERRKAFECGYMRSNGKYYFSEEKMNEDYNEYKTQNPL